MYIELFSSIVFLLNYYYTKTLCLNRYTAIYGLTICSGAHIEGKCVD